MAHRQIENVPSNNLQFEHKNDVRPTSNISLKVSTFDEESGNRKKYDGVQIVPILRASEYSSAHGNGDSSTGERIFTGETRQQKDGGSCIVNHAEAKMPQSCARKHEVFQESGVEGQVGIGGVAEKFPVVIVNGPNLFDMNLQKKCHLVYADKEAKRNSLSDKEAKRKPLKVDKADTEFSLISDADNDPEFRKLMQVESRFWDEAQIAKEFPWQLEPEMLENDEMMLNMVKAKLVKMLQYGKRRKLTVPDIDRVFDEHIQTLGNVFLRTPRLIPLMNMYGNKRWLRAFGRIHGRAFPWQVLLSQTIWVLCIYCMHPQGLGGIPSFLWRLDGWMWKVLGISVGFLLKQHAMVANCRWMEARKVWENIIDKTRGLIVILTCANTSQKLVREAVTHSLGCSICIKNWLLDAADVAWKAELMMVLPVSSCERIMQIRPSSRAIFCLYACQRVVEVMVGNRIIPRALVRDVNPRIIRLSTYVGQCEKIRDTRIPYQYIVHIRFVLMSYLMYLPFLLMGISEMTWFLLLWYVLLISYAFAGLESMANTILNPFGESESHLALDLYCYLMIVDSRFILGKDLVHRLNFVHTFESDTVHKRLSSVRKMLFWDEVGDKFKEQPRKNSLPIKQYSLRNSETDVAYEKHFGKQEVKNSQEKNEWISLQHVAIQRPTLPTQPDDLESGDVVIVGRSLDRQDLKGAQGLVISPTAKAGKKGFIVNVPPHGNIELVRTQIIFLQKGPHPQTPEAKSFLEEQRRYNESNLPLPSETILYEHKPTHLYNVKTSENPV